MTELSDTVVLPVAVVFGPDRRSVEGRLVSADRSHARIELLETAPPELEAGLGVTVRPEGQRNFEVVGVVRSVDGLRLEVDVSRAGHREDRWSPRERCHLRFRIRPVDPDTDALAWVEGHVSPPDGWIQPDPRVEISLTGLAFLAPRALTGQLLLTFVHPENDTAHRLLGEVVRHEPSRQRGIYRISVHFSEVPPNTGAALADLILALQDAALEAFGAGTTLDLPPTASDVASTTE